MRRLGFVEVAAVCSNEPATREKAARLHIPRFYDNYEDLIADPEIDVVDIATPTYLHHPIAMAAMSRGKHVIVDKPLATTSTLAAEMVDAARAAGVVNAVTFNYRYNPMVQQARLMVAKGEIGDIYLVHGYYLQEWLLYGTDFSWRLEPEKSGEGSVVTDAGCHWFDLVEHITGLRITSVFAALRTVIRTRQRPIGGSLEAFAPASTQKTEPFEVKVPDLGAAILQLQNGATVTFLTSPLCAGHKNDLRVEFHGSKASLSWIQERPNELWIGRRNAADRILVRDPGLVDPAVRPYVSTPGGHNEAWPDAFKNTMANILTFIADGRDARAADGVLFPTFQSGYRAAAIGDAMVASSRTGSWAQVALG
jgi:predicted dehydrogenase